jgi:hypothetical protein
MIKCRDDLAKELRDNKEYFKGRFEEHEDADRQRAVELEDRDRQRHENLLKTLAYLGHDEGEE